jgi:penicillin amidase
MRHEATAASRRWGAWSGSGPGTLVAAGLAALLLAGALPARAAGSGGEGGADAAGVTQRAWTVPGLTEPARIRVDAWGVPHIDAGTHYDAFFVQGFNAARDRLWQIDLWRRRGLGRLAEVFGDAYVAQDRAARLFLYRGSTFREWLAYGSDAKAITEAFVAGVNAWIGLTETDPALLPPEFGLLGYAPERWTPEDVVRIRSHGLWRNVANEVRRAALLCAVGAERLPLFLPLEPSWTPMRPDGFDPCSLPDPDTLLADYRLAKAGVSFAPLRPDAAAASSGPSEDELDGIGSNNWVVAPERTATGRPILADDPHRSHAVPSLRYVAHLRAPGLDVIGAGEPALPGISIGHNERIAFGLTIFGIDQEDLYVYELHPDDPDRYRYGDGWEPMRVLTERVVVRGGPDRSVDLRFTRHGPVIHVDRDAGRAYAVRAAWLEPGMAPYFGSVEYMRASNWREFLAALNRWGAPAENQVYADVDGHVGYKPAGLAPRRRTWDGLLPVPGDGRHEWDDFWDMDALPQAYDPDEGWIATANHMVLPPDYPVAERRIGFEWTAPWRYRRIAAVLADDDAHTLDASVALQRDYGAPFAGELVRRLDAYEPPADRPRARDAAERLRAWADAAAPAAPSLDPDSGAGALWALWYYHQLSPALAALLAPAELGTLARPDTRGVLFLLDAPERYGVDRAELHALITRTLAAARDEADALLGPDPEAWRWGDLHRMRFRHPLLELVADPELRARMELPDVPRGGDGFTPNNTGMDRRTFDVRSGASFRMVLDVGNWDAARMTNAPAQAGVPGSPFYDDLLSVWAQDGSVPMIYSEDAIRRHTRIDIRLTPAPDGGAGTGGER